MSYFLMGVIVSPMYSSSLLLKFEGCVLPDGIPGHHIICRRPAPKDYLDLFPRDYVFDGGEESNGKAVEQEEWEGVVPNERALKIIELIGEVRKLPLTREVMGGPGGTLYGLFFDEPATGGLLCWLTEPPRQWAPLGRAADELLYLAKTAYVKKYSRFFDLL